MQRPSGRTPDSLRDIRITRNFTCHAEGSVLIEFGNTKVICTASVEEGVPGFMRGEGRGWVTAEYGMLPRSTNSRMRREASAGKQSGRTVEIQRLIGRSLRAAMDMEALGENTIKIDCDVIQADGGTRTASITGACVALADAIAHLKAKGKVKGEPLKRMIASISEAVLDLDYPEDSNAETDMNIVMADDGGIIEIQGTAEAEPFSEAEFAKMMSLAKKGIQELNALQKAALSE